MTDTRAEARGQLATALRQALPLLAGMLEAPDPIQLSIPVLRAQDYAAVRRQYHDTIYGAVVGYLDSTLPTTHYKSLAGQGVLQAFPDAFYIGYAETSGGDTVAEEDDAWLTDRENAELEFVAELFQSLKALRKAGGVDAQAEAGARADGYAATLDGIYSEGRLRGSKNRVLEFGGPSGRESCRTCMGLMGKRLRISTILARGLIPAPGNEVFDCGCWQCEHYWFDPRTDERYTF